MVTPVPRMAIGESRTAAASQAIGISDSGFTANGLVLDRDPLGRGADVLTITKDGRVYGKLFHRPGCYGADNGDWHVKIDSRITLKAYDLQIRDKFPKGYWAHDAGPFDTPQKAMTDFARKIETGMQECPEAFE